MLHHYWYFQAIDDLVFALYLHSIWRKIKHYWATYEQLALGTSEAVSIKINAKDLWHKTTFLMMDSANNNLKTGQPILEILQITYVSNHLQCKSLSVEALDKSNLKILLNIEKEHGLQIKRENINPSMRSFFRGQKPIAVAGIKCQMSIFAHKKSATTTNIADEFDLIIERGDNVKYLSFCHEWKFCKLGFVWASIIDATSKFEMFLNETVQSNLHVKSSKLCFVFGMWVFSYCISQLSPQI